MEELRALGETKIASEEIYSGRVVHLYKDTVQISDGKYKTREVVRHVGAAAVVPLTADGKVIMTRQFRYPLNKVITEIPAGKLDVGEEPLEAAKRELKEETGYVAANWISLGEYYPSPAYTDECIYLYLATDLKYDEQKLDDGEFLNVMEADFEELVCDVCEGKIPDGKTQIALMKAYLLRGVK